MKTLEKQTLFWDVDLNEIDPSTHAAFVIKRVLARGDLDDIDWIMDYYGREKVQTVFLQSAHALNKKSFNFWCFYFQLDPEKCIQKSSTKTPGLFLT